MLTVKNQSKVLKSNSITTLRSDKTKMTSEVRQPLEDGNAYKFPVTDYKSK